MAAIALIGPDGAGKTTVTRMLRESGLVPFKCIYMGINPEACNVRLPTARVAEYLKHLRNRGSARSLAGGPTGRARKNALRGLAHTLWSAARLLNRLAEEWFRQLVSWYYQLRGYVVLYDRHFVFDFAEDGSAGRDEPYNKRLHRWCLAHFFPRPDFTICLDAPAELLFARKGEWGVENLEKRRQILLCQGERDPNFVRVDASQPLEKVYADVAFVILLFLACRRQKATASSGAAPVATKRRVAHAEGYSLGR